MQAARERIREGEVCGERIPSAHAPVAMDVVAHDGEAALGAGDSLVESAALGVAVLRARARGAHLARQRRHQQAHQFQ